MEPLQSALKYFKDDFEALVRDGRCRYQEHGATAAMAR
jgi:hypothetical protein